MRAANCVSLGLVLLASDILQMNLVIAEGAQFDGRVEKAQSEAELQPLVIEASGPAQQPY